MEEEILETVLDFPFKDVSSVVESLSAEPHMCAIPFLDLEVSFREKIESKTLWLGLLP